MIRIGLVGCGRWGQLILRDLRALGCQVMVADPLESAQHTARFGGAADVVGHLRNLPHCDAYVVAATTVAHAEVVLELATRGQPIFCEKPLTEDVESARRIVDVAGDFAFVMDKWRYHPGVHLLRDIARHQELGPVQGIYSTRVQWGCPHDDVDPVWILLPHDLSIALEILGDIPTPISAHQESDQHGLTSLSAVLGGPTWMHCEIGIRSPAHRRVTELRCRDGVAVLDGAYADHVGILRTSDRAAQPAQWEQRSFAPCMPLLEELTGFVAYVRGNGPAPKSSAAAGLRIVEIVSTIRTMAGINAQPCPNSPF